MLVSDRQFVRFVAENNNSSHVMTPETCLSSVHRTGISSYVCPADGASNIMSCSFVIQCYVDAQCLEHIRRGILVLSAEVHKFQAPGNLGD
jgi:hypothetical protein